MSAMPVSGPGGHRDEADWGVASWTWVDRGSDDDIDHRLDGCNDRHGFRLDLFGDGRDDDRHRPAGCLLLDDDPGRSAASAGMSKRLKPMP